MNIKIFPTGYSVFFDRMPSGFYCVKLRDRADNLIDKIHCDTWRSSFALCEAIKYISN